MFKTQRVFLKPKEKVENSFYFNSNQYLATSITFISIMYNCVHLQNSYIRFCDSKKSCEFVEEINEIDNFHNFFDHFEISEHVENNDCYELTYDGRGLSSGCIVELINDVISLCKNFNCELNLTIKIFDDGIFLLYLIVCDNQVYEISSRINSQMKYEEKLLKK